MSADLFNIIFVGGEDRVDFLQGQVTQDIEKLDENTTRNAAFCNPKGRVIATCQLFQFNEKIGVIIHHTMSEIIINRKMLSQLALSDPKCFEKIVSAVNK